MINAPKTKITFTQILLLVLIGLMLKMIALMENIQSYIGRASDQIWMNTVTLNKDISWEKETAIKAQKNAYQFYDLLSSQSNN